MTKLFSLVRVGDHELAHRIVMAPLTRYRCDDAWVPLPMVKGRNHTLPRAARTSADSYRILHSASMRTRHIDHYRRHTHLEAPCCPPQCPWDLVRRPDQRMEGNCGCRSCEGLPNMVPVVVFGSWRHARGPPERRLALDVLFRRPAEGRRQADAC